MRRVLKILAIGLALLLLVAALLGGWYVRSKQPRRSGEIALTGLTSIVTVRYDERGVPHIGAGNEHDLYRALGYVHAQDRLFQMEMTRRLARGELSEILGPKLVEVDQLFRTLGIRDRADRMAERIDQGSQAAQAFLAYLDGINQYQRDRPAPMEFDLLGIPKRAFTMADAYSVTGYMAYTFAMAFSTEPAMTHVRDKLGPDYLKVFDLDWHPEGVLGPAAGSARAARLAPSAQLTSSDWQGLAQLARVSREALADAGIAQFEGSNAWAVSGSLTTSGKPLLAGDPHIAFSAPAIWYEAHLSAPGFELYGHHLGLMAFALLGHNQQFGWTLTMFQNDDLDLIAEKVNPTNPNQVWHKGQWVDLQAREETIAVKGAAPVRLTLRRSPHGPIVSDAFGQTLGRTPVAMWWAFLETENPIFEAFHALNRADTLAKARAAASRIHAPGLNVVYANAAIQHATYGFLPLDANWGTVIAMLAAWAVAGLALSMVAYRHATAGR